MTESYCAPTAPDGEPCYWCDPENGPCRIHTAGRVIRCECDYCPCDDPAEKHWDADPIEDYQGGWLCWNCAMNQHHSCDFFWCPPSHRGWEFT